MPLLESNIKANAHHFRTPAAYPRALVLDWDNDVLPDDVNAIRDELDVIVYVRSHCSTLYLDS